MRRRAPDYIVRLRRERADVREVVTVSGCRIVVSDAHTRAIVVTAVDHVLVNGCHVRNVVLVWK